MSNSIIFIIRSSCDNKEQAESTYMAPLGVLSITNMLRVNGYNVHVLDFSEREYEANEIYELINKVKPIYIAFSVYTQNVDNIFNVCKALKKRFKDIPIVLGGPHPTLDTDYCKKKRFVDFISVGDGEQNLLELAEALRTKEELISFKDIPGLVYLDEDRKYKSGGERVFLTNIDLIPIINRDYIPKYFKALIPNIYSTRGCPGRCIYCAAPAMSGGKYRIREIENVFLETLYIEELCKNYSEIFYCDDTFTVFNKRVEKFISLCNESKVKFNWRCESRVDAMFKNSYLLEGLKDAGCKRIQFGIESGNQEILDKIRKNMKLPQAYEIIDKTINTGIGVATSFIFGHYCDTVETMEDTVKMMEELKSKYGEKIGIAYGLNTPYPGTYQYDNMEDLGLEMTVSKFSELDMLSPVVQTKNFTTEDLKKINSRAMKIYF
ncbi:MAG: B12-binding domain-containing radical SAM protein [Clostridium sp.]|nr:B12-binding domain-containing radical SAM protein [Clostridium sp.]